MQMSGSKALCEILRREGVEYVFGIPGATEVRFMDALEDYPDIKYVLGLHEVVAAGAAEGYARTSGKVGVLNLHTNTGLSAALPLLANAFTGGVPLVVTAGQQDTRLRAYEPHLTGDLVKIAAPVTKWGFEITNVEDIPVVLKRAFKTAAHPPTGPVFVSLPQNILGESFDFEYPKSSAIGTHVHPDPESVKEAVSLLARARNPLMIVQDGIAKSEALADAVEFAELIGAKVYQPWMGDVNFPLNHPLYVGDLDMTSTKTWDMLAEVDILVAIGTPLFSVSSYLAQARLSASTKVIQIDNNAWEIGKNNPVDCGIEGDIKASLVDLTSALRAEMTATAKAGVKNRTSEIGLTKKKSDEEFFARAQKERDDTPITPSRLMQEIKENIKPGTRIVDDCWSSSAVLRRTLAFSEPKSFQRSRSGGSIGFGLPGALGVKLASPDRPVVCVSGDGSAAWSIQSLWTASHYNIPVCFIIMANGCYQMVRSMKSRLLGEAASGRNLGTDLCQPQIDFCRVAEGFGLQTQRVDRPDQLGPALKQGFGLKGPNLIEVRTRA